MSKRKLKSLNVEAKLKLLEEIDKGLKKKKDIAAQFGIPASTLSTILKNRVAFKHNVDKSHKFNPGKKRFARCAYEDVDKCVVEWIESMLNRNMPLTSDSIRQKARDVAASLGHESFQASNGWLFKFKVRHGIFQVDLGGNSPSATSIEATERRRSMSDHKGNEPVKSECPGNVEVGDYIDTKTDDLIDDIGSIKTEPEDDKEDREFNIKDPLLFANDACMEIALQTIRTYLNCKNNASESVYNSLSDIESYFENERRNSEKP